MPTVPLDARRRKSRWGGLLGGGRRAEEAPVADEPILRRLSEPELALVEAADLFNSSPHRRTVAGVAKSLGAPKASIVPLSGVSGEMVVTVAWEISWYQYRVSPDAPQPVRLVERGHDLEELEDELPGVERAARRRRPADAGHRPRLAELACPTRRRSLLFAAAALALIVVPGPAVLYIVAQSIDRGRLAGIVSALGVAVGGLVHVTAAAIGLSSLLVSSATAFTVVKYAGAAYLIGLGLYTLLATEGRAGGRCAERAPPAPPLLAGRRRQRPEPEDGALLLRLPAAVRRSGQRLGRAADRRPRPPVRRARGRSATASGRSRPGPPRSGCAATGASSRCSATSPARSSSGSAR